LQSLLGRETGAAQADDVEAANLVLVECHGEGRQILTDGGAALHHGERAHAGELVDETIAGNEGAILHDGVPGEERAAGQDDVIADYAVVADVRILHQEIVGADEGFSIGLGRAMDGAVFAENVFVADADASGRAVVFQILGGVADDAAGVEPVLGTDDGDSGEVNVRTDDTARADLDGFVDDGVRADGDGGIQFCFRMNDGCRMNHRLRK